MGAGPGAASASLSRDRPEGPAHQPRFTTEVVVEGEKPAAGEGPSKRAAEQAAALALLRRLGIVDATP
ncbi:MAG: putative dsRNA-binding protein [Hyphomicrobiaceae bacterium]